MTNSTALAYVFWHWKQESVATGEYEARQRAFHQALAANPPEGFWRSVSSAVTGAPWANEGGDAYEDRYLICDSAALDVLDRAVAGGIQRVSHDSAAAIAAGGTAGLYRARLGTPLAGPRYAAWFAKPHGVTYEQFLARCAPLVRPDETVLWMRRMVLGPTPEFCLESTTPAAVPREFQALTLSFRPVWEP